MAVNYVESTYQFTDPVRYFKANDPYYFEVDNLPLKQLQENCLWLKDQLAKKVFDDTKVKRSDFDELRPYADGTNRLVKVKPGRYTGRVNDASTKEPLGYLLKVFGEELGQTEEWDSAFPSQVAWPPGKDWTVKLYNALEKFKSTLPADALGMTGLVGRAFAWPMVNANTPLNVSGGVMYPITQNPWFRWDMTKNNPGGNKLWHIPTILTEAMVWYRQQNIGGQYPFWRMYGYDSGDSNIGAALQGEAESWFIRRWRGVSRLAIVDVDDELSISIPPFDAGDFSYTDSTGNVIAVPGVQSRIDLVFIYSKPIDTSGVKLMRSSTVETITKPQLGIVRGAGIRTTEEGTGNKFTGGLRRSVTDDNRILAAPADQYNTSMGFNSTSANDIDFAVRGSFPSPDDILNIAPLLSEKLESEAYELLGQSILPVAYVWVQNSGSTDSAGSVVIDSSDVIDIRPLMRTAELAYNERAGIAAAVPQISISNPVVSRTNLDYESLQLYNYINAQFSESGGGGGGGTSVGGMPVLAAGYVFGGYNFGPEGALWDFYKTRDGTDDATTRDNIRLWYYGQTATNPPMYPDWDEAYWVGSQGVTDGGKYPNDYINTFLSQGKSDSNSPYKDDQSLVGGSYSEQVFDNGTTKSGTGGSVPARIVEFGAADVGQWNHSFQPKNRVQFHYIQKKIMFANALPSWLHDYTVEVDLVNCLPETFFGTAYDYGKLPQPAGYVGHWVEKTPSYFTIYVAFAARHTEHHESGTNASPKKADPELPWKRRTGGDFSSFVVPVQDILKSNLKKIPTDTPSGHKTAGGNGYAGNPRIGICTYPTVSWTVTGIPNADLNYFYSNLNGTNPQITLKS